MTTRYGELRHFCDNAVCPDAHKQTEHRFITIITMITTLTIITTITTITIITTLTIITTTITLVYAN